MEKDLTSELGYLGQCIPLHYHYQMLADKVRMAGFGKAIKHTVKEGSIVADFGCGTGVMAFKAAREGAIVNGVEMNPALVKQSRLFLESNKMSDRVTINHGDAMKWEATEPVDVVVCEMLHSALLREKQVEVIMAFKEKYLQKYQRVPKFIPYATLLGIQPVWHNYDFDGYYAPVPFFQDPYSDVSDTESVINPQIYQTVIYEEVTSRTIKGEITFSAQSETRVNALRFITKNILSADQVSGEIVDWHNQYLIIPIKETLSLKGGDQLKVSFSYEAGDAIEVLMKGLKWQII